MRHSPLRFATSIVIAAAALASSSCSDSPTDDGADASIDAPAPESGTSDRSVQSDGTRADGIAQDALSEDDRSIDVDWPPEDTTSADSATDRSRADSALDAPFDTAPDAPNCPDIAIWSAGSAGFTLSGGAGVATSPLPRACVAGLFLYDFDATSRKLSFFCANPQGLAKEVEVDAGLASQIVAAISAFRTTCEVSCRMETGVESLTVRNGAGCTQQTYETNNGCSPSPPPNVRADDVIALHELLDAALGCGTDGGLDGGSCTFDADAGTPLCKMVHRDPDAGASDAATDTPSDTPSSDSDGSTCQSVPVWRDFSYLRLQSLGTAIPLPDGGCDGATASYELSIPTRFLRQFACSADRTTIRRVDMTDAQIDRIADVLSSLHTVCGISCPANARFSLTLSDCNNKHLASFSTNAKMACDGPTPPAPWVDGVAMGALQGVLSAIVSESCGANADAGSPNVCSPRCRELIR